MPLPLSFKPEGQTLGARGAIEGFACVSFSFKPPELGLPRLKPKASPLLSGNWLLPYSHPGETTDSAVPPDCHALSPRAVASSLCLFLVYSSSGGMTF